MYELAKYIHILCAIIWVGGALYIQILAIRIQRSSDPSVMGRLGPEVEFIGTRVFVPASILLFLAGAFMTSQRWAFSQAWISIAIVLWLVSVLVGSFYLGPQSKKIGQLVAAEGPGSPGAGALLGRVFLISRLELVSFAVIVALMTFKPGAG
jgi:uncharacterized membrane protein